MLLKERNSLCCGECLPSVLWRPSSLGGGTLSQQLVAMVTPLPSLAWPAGAAAPSPASLPSLLCPLPASHPCSVPCQTPIPAQPSKDGVMRHLRLIVIPASHTGCLGLAVLGGLWPGQCCSQGWQQARWDPDPKEGLLGLLLQLTLKH